MDQNTPEQWFKSLPILTRIGLSVFLSATVLVAVGIIGGPVQQPALLILNWPLALRKMQVWRLITTVCYLGPFGMHFLFECYFFTTFSGKLENNEIFRQPGEYLFFLLCQILMLDVVSLVLRYPDGVPLLGHSLVFAIIYYWSRREPYAELSFFMFKVKGYQLPFAIMLFNILMGGGIWMELLGLATGHLWYFLKEVVPAEYGRILIKTPTFFNTFMAGQLGQSHAAAQAAAPRGGGAAPAPAPNRFGGAGHRLGGN
mmetsp:Transcript_64061/g.152778  ORF Transcript_64061/g.152778 Transcript_64061/m.152778 type:complete len:257 (+) Transcript_64061:107-877(+)|eukprot:CAMPEP_0178390666 /NCGR_PEP_ID=MMETSP0689_2-20121128/10763_1 /TAXON_ID=160604 /ORGANISM="Amphidinium massartii, Strain CS-259" /LENGTH=256 /DNA_ID=CAMNT_0020011181 /DNA_START=40 /DNA_END=810 /DNA_ORIENTATION=-